MVNYEILIKDGNNTKIKTFQNVNEIKFEGNFLTIHLDVILQSKERIEDIIIIPLNEILTIRKIYKNDN